MRHSQYIREEVRRLRILGNSLGTIASKTNLPRTTIRSWIKDIPLSEEQLKQMRENALQSLQEGRKNVQQKNKKIKEENMSTLFNKGIEEIGELDKKELFVTGVALYWAEGFKNQHEHRLGFCNSDPTMVRFYLHWLKNALGIDKKDIVLRVTLNKAYEANTSAIEKYWSQITDIPLEQFTKPFYQNSLWKKRFNDEKYYGVLRIHVKDSLEYLLKMKGWIQGLRNSMAG